MMKKLILIVIQVFVISVAMQAQSVKDAMGMIVREEFIFPTQGLHSHGSSIVELPNGDLLSCWFFGTGERKANDVKVMGARLKKGATKWSEPFVMADTPDVPDCNPVLFLNHDGNLFLVWIAVMADEWWHSILRYKTTKDYLGEGAPKWEWQDVMLFKDIDDSFEKDLAAGYKQIPYTHPLEKWYDKMMLDHAHDMYKRNIGWMTRIKPLLLEEKRIVLPLYSDMFNVGIMAISDDDGTTWNLSSPIAVRGGIQPALAVRSNGDILALMRGNSVSQSVSHDNGNTWEPAKMLNLPNAASVELLKLQDGRFIMVYNDQTSGRNQLCLMVSYDEGATWPYKDYVEYVPKEAGGFSYPALIQTKDGMIHLTYSYAVKENKTIRHLVIDPKQIKPTKVVCHRGYTDGMPENTLVAFKKAVELGADYIEIDIRRSKEDSLMILHDGSLNRTTTGEGPIREKSYAELRKLSAGAKANKQYTKEKIPTLEETCLVIAQACKKAGRRVSLYVDCKDVLVTPMLATLEKHDLLAYAAFYGSVDKLKEIKAACPTARVMPSLSKKEDIKPLKEALNPFAVDAKFTSLSAELVEACHNEGILVFSDVPHELETKEAIEKALSYGIDGLQTDRLVKINGFVSEYKR